MSQRLLQTKFHIPTPRQADLSRPMLMESINKGIALRHRLTLISAPAGYGKTTLLTSWHHFLPAGKSLAWLSLDKRDNDPVRFLHYWIAAFQNVNSSIGQTVQSLLSMPQHPPLQSLVDEMINDLVGMDGQTFCVLDDYHTIRNPEIHAAIDHFIEYLPERNHLLITTREDPPLALPRLRVRRQITEIRAQTLRFSKEEALHYLNETVGLELDPQSVETLVARTEGWAAGLQLAGIALQNLPDQNEFLSDFSGSHRYVIDYLLDEVLSQQPQEIRTFLVRTAHLDRFNAGLAEAVTDEPNAGDRLQDLARANLFIIPLDSHREWYRYHHLFSDVLCASAPPGTAQEVSVKAAAWLESHRFLGDAIDNWLASGNPDEAARVIKISAVDQLKNGEIQTLLGWLEGLPQENRHQDLDLSALYALCLLLTGQINLAQNHLNQISTQAPSPSSNLDHGPFLAIRAWFASTAGSPDTGILAESALKALDEKDQFFQVLALLALGSQLAWADNLKDSSEVFRKAYSLSQAMRHPFTSMGALANLTFNLLDMGQLREAETLCRAALTNQIDDYGKPLPILGVIYSPLAAICYEKGDFEQAEEFAKKAIDLSNKLFSTQILGGDAEVVLARIAFEHGHLENALEIIHTTAQAARERPVPIVRYKMAVTEVELYLLAGNQIRAKTSLNNLERLIPTNLPKAKQIAQHLQARYLILTGKEDRALTILQNLLESDLSDIKGRRLMGLHLSCALAYQQQGENTRSLSFFNKALTLAAGEGYRSLFLPHEGRQTLSLLQKSMGKAPDFIQSILDLSGDSRVSPSLDFLPDPLTEQEQRVLNLIIMGKSNQEIADTLVISVGTAKWHVHNILTKLDASNRIEAANRARALGFE